MRLYAYQLIVVGVLAQLGCASTHNATPNETPPMLGAAAKPDQKLNPAVDVVDATGYRADLNEVQPSQRVPPGYMVMPVSHSDSLRIMAGAQESLAIPKVQPGRGIDFDHELGSCLDMMPESVRGQVSAK